MRTIVDIPTDSIKMLKQLSEEKKVSRAEIIRQAISHYISNYLESKKESKSAFGIWKKKNLNSILYQSEKIGNNESII